MACACSQHTGAAMGVVVWEETLQNIKDRVNAEFEGFATAVTLCAELDDGLRKSWENYLSQWRKFYLSPVPFFGRGSEYDLAEEYERGLARWQTTIAPFCKNPLGPQVVPHEEQTIPGLLESVSGPLKWVAIAAVAGAGAYALFSFAPLLSLAKKKR